MYRLIIITQVTLYITLEEVIPVASLEEGQRLLKVHSIKLECTVILLTLAEYNLRRDYKIYTGLSRLPLCVK